MKNKQNNLGPRSQRDFNLLVFGALFGIIGSLFAAGVMGVVNIWTSDEMEGITYLSTVISGGLVILILVGWTGPLKEDTENEDKMDAMHKDIQALKELLEEKTPGN
jgi:hypothetical protein